MDKTKRYPTALTIAGSDSGGGAGIQADLKTFSALGVYGVSAITAITAQNTIGVRAIQTINPYILQAQVEAVMDDITIDAIKIGMLHSPEIVKVVASAIDKYSPDFVILDPVMIATSGDRLIEDKTIAIIKSELFSRVTLITPNIDEAELLSGIDIQDEKDMIKSGKILLESGCKAVLLKGGHLKGKTMTDILLIKGEKPISFSAGYIESENTHGTGCTFSSAIAAYLALSFSLEKSVEMAKEYITKAISEGASVKTGHGHGPLNHFFAPKPLSPKGERTDEENYVPL